MAKNVKEINVISRWGVLVLGEAGKEQRFFSLVQRVLEERGWPFPVKLEDVGEGWFGVKKQYLETKGPYGKLVAYVGAETIGRDIYLNWSLTLDEPGLFKKAVAAGGGFAAEIFQAVNFNQANAARAFASSLNHAVQQAADVILDEAGADKSKVNREAQGILGRLI